MQLLRPILSNQFIKIMIMRTPEIASRSYGHATKKKFPDLLYFPHFARWIATKLKFKYLQSTWDPEFQEGAFIYGSTHAICKITEIISRNEPDRLKNLLTKDAETKLREFIELKLTPAQKSVIQLKPADIKLFVPIKVSLIRDDENNRMCKVLLKSLAMKWYDDQQVLKLVLIVLETEFKREYNKGSKPEWYISLFDIVQCVMLGGNNGTPHLPPPP